MRDAPGRAAGVAVLAALSVTAVLLSEEARDAVTLGTPEPLSQLYLDDAYFQQSSPPSCFAAVFGAAGAAPPGEGQEPAMTIGEECLTGVPPALR